MPQSVYFIQCEETKRIKIGVSGDPMKRLAQLQTGSPGRLKMLATIPGDESTEAEYHRRFEEKRKGGEWFDISEEDVMAVVRPPEPEPAHVDPTLWRIKGDLEGAPGGHVLEMFVLTDGLAESPDPRLALNAYDPMNKWKCIRSIERVWTASETAYHLDINNESPSHVVNGSSLYLTPDMLGMLVSQFLLLRCEQDFAGELIKAEQAARRRSSPGLYQGVRMSVGGGDYGEIRLSGLIDMFSEEDRRILMLVHVHEKALTLLWLARVPSAYAVGNTITLDGRFTLTIERSEDVGGFIR